MYFELGVDDPRVSGNRPYRLTDKHSITLMPYPSCFCQSRRSRPVDGIDEIKWPRHSGSTTNVKDRAADSGRILHDDAGNRPCWGSRSARKTRCAQTGRPEARVGDDPTVNSRPEPWRHLADAQDGVIGRNQLLGSGPDPRAGAA